MGDVDLVLVEGFKNEGDYPKYEVFRPDATPEGPLFPDALLAGVISNVSAETLGTDLPVLPIDEPERVFAAKISGEFLFGKGLCPLAKERR